MANPMDSLESALAKMDRRSDDDIDVVCCADCSEVAVDMDWVNDVPIPHCENHRIPVK